jgi:hypothetical protein
VSDIIFEHRHVDGNYVIEMTIIRVKKDADYPEGIKYSLVIIDRTTGKRVLGFDNHERRGHHIHKGKKEIKYSFVDEWTLIEDFTKEYEKIRRS